MTELTSSDATTALTYVLDDGIAIVTLDDGKANAITHDVLAGLDAALDRALDEDAHAVVIAGRDGRFSAGFDLATMTSSLDGMQRLVELGGRLFARLYGYGLPTVAACTGHALAGGAILLLSLDHRVGADAPAKIGLNEVAIGMGLPIFAVELARDRLAARHLGRATMAAHIYDPAGAVEAGYLDRLVPAESVVDEAVADARRLAELRTGAYVRTKRLVRQRTVDHILATLDADIASLGAPDT
jgi:enoyl-CoA hydratase